MLNTLLFFGWVVIAVVVVWKRVHLHFRFAVELKTDSPKCPRAKSAGVRGSGPQPVPEVQTASAEDCSKQDCVSALVNLGCDRKSARAAVERACSQGPAEFEELLRRAIREAA
jgi:Holliday junction resolvasome RuvABC DNA-binding subunit